MATQTAVNQRGDLKSRIVIESDLSPIADDFDLDLSNLDLLGRVQVGVKMLNVGGTPQLATSGDMDVSFETPNNNQLEGLQQIDVAAPTTLTLPVGITRLRVVPNTVVAGSVTDYQVVVTLYPA